MQFAERAGCSFSRLAYNQAAQAEIRRARTKSIATYGELMAMTVAMLNEATVFSGTHGISGVSEMLAGLPGIRGGLVEALACYIDTEQCGTALEIGADALASAAERDFILSEPGQVLALMLKALRDRSAWVLHTEIVLVALVRCRRLNRVKCSFS